MTGSDYLKPYELAADRHGGGFGSLLWASPRTQRLRFEAIARSAELVDKSVLDAGCGRADLLQFFLEQKIAVTEYIGLEAISALADVAEEATGEIAGGRIRILRGDFVREPIRLFVGADVVVFSGSLNTLAPAAFYETLAHAWEAAGEVLIFNFLSSSRLAGREYLHWHEPHEVLRFAGKLSGAVRSVGDYLPGDTTVVLHKQHAGTRR